MENFRNMSIRMLALCRRAPLVWVIASAGLAAVHNGVAVAQDTPAGSVTVAPAIAVVDTARRIAIRGNWSNACPPSTAEIVADTSPTPTQLTIRLNEIFTFAACAQVITPYTIDLNYTPRSAGVLPIIVLTTGGQKVAEGRMSTVGKDDAAATFNLNGAWFESPTAKSILMISHSQTNPDSLVGTWTLFGTGGQPTSWVFHSSIRQAKPNVYDAAIYFPQSEGAPPERCLTLSTPYYPGCPSPGGFNTRFVGRLHLEVLSNREIKAEVIYPTQMFGYGFGFSTTLTRYEF